MVFGSIFEIDDGLGEVHFFENDGLGWIAQRFAGAGILEALQSNDVASKGFFDFFAIIGVHQIHAARALFLIARRVRERHALLELTRVDAAERNRAYMLKAHDLEGDHGQRLAVRRLAQHRRIGPGIDARIGFAVKGRGKEINHCVEQAAARPCS